MIDIQGESQGRGETSVFTHHLCLGAPGTPGICCAHEQNQVLPTALGMFWMWSWQTPERWHQEVWGFHRQHWSDTKTASERLWQIPTPLCLNSLTTVHTSCISTTVELGPFGAHQLCPYWKRDSFFLVCLELVSSTRVFSQMKVDTN